MWQIYALRELRKLVAQLNDLPRDGISWLGQVGGKSRFIVDTRDPNIQGLRTFLRRQRSPVTEPSGRTLEWPLGNAGLSQGHSNLEHFETDPDSVSRDLGFGVMNVQIMIDDYIDRRPGTPDRENSRKGYEVWKNMFQTPSIAVTKTCTETTTALRDAVNRKAERTEVSDAISHGEQFELTPIIHKQMTSFPQAVWMWCRHDRLVLPWLGHGILAAHIRCCSQ
jgi:hypothetical protein